jgi:hypothetical protein
MIDFEFHTIRTRAIIEDYTDASGASFEALLEAFRTRAAALAATKRLEIDTISPSIAYYRDIELPNSDQSSPIAWKHPVYSLDSLDVEGYRFGVDLTVYVDSFKRSQDMLDFARASVLLLTELAAERGITVPLGSVTASLSSHCEIVDQFHDSLELERALLDIPVHPHDGKDARINNEAFLYPFRAETDGNESTARPLRLKYSSHEAIVKTIQRLLDKHPLPAAIYAKNLDTGEAFGVDAETTLFTTMPLRLPILIEVHRQIDQGRLALTDTTRELVTLNAVLEHRLSVELKGSKRPQGIQAGEGLTLESLITRMCIENDPRPAAALIGSLCPDRITATLRAMQLRETRLESPRKADLIVLSNAEAIQTLDADNLYAIECPGRATPRELAMLMKAVIRDEFLSIDSRVSVLHSIDQQASMNALDADTPYNCPDPIQLPDSERFWTVTRGDVSHVRHDNGHYIIGLVNDTYNFPPPLSVKGDGHRSNRLLGRICRMLYFHLDGGPVPDYL